MGIFSRTRDIIAANFNDMLDKADPSDETAARMYRVDVRPWQLAKQDLDGLATFSSLETDTERNILVDKLLF